MNLDFQTDCELKPNARDVNRTPGETIHFALTYHAEKETEVTGLHARFVGVCETSGFSPETTTCTFTDTGCNVPIEKKVYSPGTHTFPFSIPIPHYCELSKGTVRGPWVLTPLPSTCDGLGLECSIKYHIKVQLTTRGTPRQYSHTLPVSIASLESQTRTSSLVQDRTFTERKVTVKFHGYTHDTSWRWAQRVLGYDLSTESEQLLVQLAHSAAGLPSWDCPLKNVASLVVFKVGNQTVKEPCEYLVRGVSSRMKYTIVTTFPRCKYTRKVEIYETPENYEKPLEFKVNKDGRAFCDISECLSPTPSEVAPMNIPFANVRTPALLVSTTLEVDVKISPSGGCPRPICTVHLESPVFIYNTKGNVLPEGAKMLPLEGCPPPSYSA